MIDRSTSLAIETAQGIAPLLAGLGPDVQGAILADLVATWLAGFQGGADDDTAEFREAMLADWLVAMRSLIPVNEQMIQASREET